MKALTFLKLTVILSCLIVMAIPVRQVGAKECTIYAVEEPTKDLNWFNHNAAKAAKEKGYPVVRHKTISELESKVKQKFKDENCTCLKELYIVGHASSEWMSVGCGAWKECKKTEYMDVDNKLNWDPTFLVLQSYFCKTSPQIVFYGCSAGVCDNASNVLHTIAKSSGAPVKAPIAIIVHGSKLFDYLKSGEWQYGNPTDASPKPCKKGKFITLPAKKKTASVEYYCPCDKLAYSGLTECINSCSVTLKCPANICDRYYSNNTWDQQGSNPVLTAGATGSWNSHGVSQPAILRASPYAL